MNSNSFKNVIYKLFIYKSYIYIMPRKFICNLWFLEVFTNNNFQTDISLLLYNSSIVDIEHSPNYIALGSPQSELVTTNTVTMYEFSIK